MKSLDQILKQEPIYLNDWFENKQEQLIHDFEIVGVLDDKVNILFASYGYANYSGDAWVLFEKDGKLYEVNGSHCSCYGLEYQWEPEEVYLDCLEHRLVNGTFGQDDWSDNNFKDELCRFLGIGQN